MLLEIRTTIMIAAVLALIVGASLRFVLRDYPDSLAPSLRLWIIGTLLLPTAWVLYVLRDTIPDYLSIVVANTLLSLGFAKQVEAVRAFVHLPDNRALIYSPVLAVLFSECLFTYGMPSLSLRGISVSATIGVQLLSAVPALRGLGKTRRKSHLLTATAFASLGGALIVRAACELLLENGLPSPFASSPMQTIAFGLGACFPIAATLGFLLMCNDRLYEALSQNRAQLALLAQQDSLTRLANRSKFDEALNLALAEAERIRRPLSLLYIDIDHFKAINDAYGHAVGDGVLQEFAQRLRQHLRRSDLAARIGGDEFAVLIEDTPSLEAPENVARKILSSLKRDFHVDGLSLHVGASIGVAAGRIGMDAKTLIAVADEALYEAKRAGRGTYRLATPPDVDPRLHAQDA